MEKRRRVLLYGKSVILGTVGASLQHHPELEVLPMASPSPDVHELSALAPDVILYDVEASRPESAISLLEIYPELLLIGVSPESSRVMLWSGRQVAAVEAADLVSIIQRKGTDSETFKVKRYENHK